jgi:hypothetical protein
MDKWHPEYSDFNSLDGNYQESLNKYIVVDMSDPNDPFAKDVDGFTFYYGYHGATKYIENEIPAPKRSYVLMSEFNLHFNHPYDANNPNLIKQYMGRSYLYINGGDVTNDDGGLSSNWSGLNILEAYIELAKSGSILNSGFVPSGDNAMKINSQRGLPSMFKDMSSSGGSFISYQPYLFPYGDLTPPGKTAFTNNIVLVYSSGGNDEQNEPVRNTKSIYDGHTDYTLSNR